MEQTEKVVQLKTGSIVDLQIWYDIILPQCSVHNLLDDQKIVEISKRELIVETVSIDLAGHNLSQQPRPAMSPHLRTSMYPPAYLHNWKHSWP